VARVTARVTATDQQQQKGHSDGGGTMEAAARGNESRLPARKRPRRSEPASPPTGPTAAAGSSNERTSQQLHRLRDVQARRQSKAQELGALRAQFRDRCAVFEGELDLLAKEEVALRTDIAADHNRSQCSLIMLPNEVRQLVLGMVGIQAVGRLAVTSKDWQHSLVDPVIWRMIAHAADAKGLCQLLVQMCADVELATICCQRVFEIGDHHTDKDMTAEGTAFNAAGGCKALVAAMRSHASVANLQAEACHALRNLSRGSEGRAAALAAGGAEAVVGALRAHPSVAAVQEMGCKAVVNLAFKNAECKAALLAVGGAEAVVGALRAHPGVAAVQVIGCAAVVNLAFRNAGGQAALLAVGGAEAVVGALRAHPSVAGVQEHGCKAARSLALNSAGGQAALLAAGGAEAVVGALRAHPGAAAVQEKGCKLVCKLASCAEGKAPLRRRGAEQLARDAALNHPSHSGVQKWSRMLVRVLMVSP
jgi:hypothetical protein